MGPIAIGLTIGSFMMSSRRSSQMASRQERYREDYAAAQDKQSQLNSWGSHIRRVRRIDPALAAKLSNDRSHYNAIVDRAREFDSTNYTDPQLQYELDNREPATPSVSPYATTGDINDSNDGE